MKETQELQDLNKCMDESRENKGTERETPSLALGICEFHLSYF